MRNIIIASAAALAFLLTACEDKKDDQVNLAQQCLNTATPATVDACVAKVSGLTSPQAYMIRCSADFMRANITTESIIDAWEELDKNPNPSTNATVTLFKFFKFGNPTAAADAVNNCRATGSINIHNLSLAAKVATLVNQLMPDPVNDDLQDWVDNLDQTDIDAITDEQLEAVGDVVAELAPQVCGVNGQFHGTKVCTDLMNAIDTVGIDNLVDLAKELLKELQEHN